MSKNQRINNKNLTNVHTQKEKYASLLVLQFKAFRLKPEISNSPRFRIQGGFPEHDT